MEQNLEPEIETKTKNKKRGFLIAGVIMGVVVIAVAAFIGGRFLNQQLAPAGLMSLGGGEGGMVSMSVEIVPAPELPTTAPDVTGTFAERQDNTIYVQTFSMDMGSGGGVVVSSSSVSSSDGEPSVVVSGPSNSGPKVEVVVTNDTLIYTDVTPMNLNPGEETVKVQQVVEPGNLDDLTTQTMITVWGRKVGDRVIADVIAYSNPVMLTVP
jgi:hypothetical protein